MDAVRLRGRDAGRRWPRRTRPRRSRRIRNPPLRRPRVTGFAQSIITIILFILILGGLVIIHELGHFVTARLGRVRVLEFGIGFPPRAKVLGAGGAQADDIARYEADLAAAKARIGVDPDKDQALLEAGPPGGTLYTLNWLPIGGFVRARRRGRQRPGRPAFVRGAGHPQEADDPGRRRGDERRARVRHLHRDRVARVPVRRRPVLRGPTGFAGRHGGTPAG